MGGHRISQAYVTGLGYLEISPLGRTQSVVVKRRWTNNNYAIFTGKGRCHMGREREVGGTEGAVSMRFPVRRSSVAGVVAYLCGLACVLGAGVVPGVAAANTQFGETGTGAGQISGPIGVAINNDPVSLFYGDVYVADSNNNRLDRFSSSGSFQLAWGWGVASGANELQTCMATCRRGPPEEQNPPQPVNTGAVSFPSGVAVDSNPLSSSAGDVYVVQAGDIQRVEKFGPSGEFLLMFGGDVNETTGGNVCSSGEKCKRSTEGPADGQFEGLASQGTSIAVGPDGSVYVGDRARVQVFEPTGVWRETISLAGVSSTGDVTALAVDAAGNVFVKDKAAPGVREFEPNGVEKSIQFDASSTTITGIAVNGSGDLFVGESSGESYAHILKYEVATGKLTGSFGAKTARGGNATGPFEDGMAFSEASDAVYVSETYSAGGFYSSVWALPIPPPGPEIEGESVTSAPPGGMILEGSVNPEGYETEYHFEYVSEVAFRASGFAHATSTATGSLPASIASQSVQMHLTGLPTSEVFYYRLVASNVESVGPVFGHEETFQSLPAGLIGAEYVTDVASSSATIAAEVNALGSSTEYNIEYGVSTAYEHDVSGSAGGGTSDVAVSGHLQELTAGTTYHYRAVLHNGLGTVAGPDQTFITQSANGSSALIDGRTWELVSPVAKHGALLELEEDGGDVQAASDGSGIAYMAEAGSPGEAPAGKIERAQIVSTRGPKGWSTQDLTLPGGLPEDGISAEHLFHVYPEYRLFSPDLSRAAVEPQEFGTPLLSPEATERTLYLRDDSNGSFLPLVSPADVPSDAQIEEPELAFAPSVSEWQMQFLAATPDLGHVIFWTPMALTPEAVQFQTLKKYKEERLHGGGGEPPPDNLYEWGDGKLQLVNILPSGEGVAMPDSEGVAKYATLAGLELKSNDPRGGVPRAVSSNGRRVAWTWGEAYGDGDDVAYKGLYVRDMAEERTVKVGGESAMYQTMNAEGSKIFYLEGGDLYVYEWETGKETGKSIDLTGDHGGGEPNGGAQELVSDISEDGSYVYFVATSVLAEGGVSGANNLYLLHNIGSGWTTTHIATLSSEDKPDWFDANGPSPYLAGIASRVSPDGRYLAFMSNRSLTGYDNHDAASGAPDEEVYLYDAQAGKLVCSSCDPTGARPEGVYDGDQSELLVDRNGVWQAKLTDARNHQTTHWLAGNIPGWDDLSNDPATYQPRYLSDSGRLFFDSPAGLVPQDTNGLEDVYEYEPEGVGACTSATSSAVEVYVKELAGSPVGGCVGLLSSGTSSSESAFYDASENGDDVFFDTTSKLVPEDADKAYDVYDAHVCSSTVPCTTKPVPPPPCDSGDSCKAAPSPQPTVFGAPASATFNGAGNISPVAAPPAVAKKKAAKCSAGKKLRGGRCMKSKSKRKGKAKRAGAKRRAKS